MSVKGHIYENWFCSKRTSIVASTNFLENTSCNSYKNWLALYITRYRAYYLNDSTSGVQMPADINCFETVAVIRPRGNCTTGCFRAISNSPGVTRAACTRTTRHSTYNTSCQRLLRRLLRSRSIHMSGSTAFLPRYAFGAGNFLR